MQLSEIKPQFIMVVGGAGSGKNYFIEHDPTYSKYTLVDVDAVKKTVSVSMAISSIKPMLQAAFEKHINVVHPGTAANLKAAQNKIAMAKSYGYTVTVILIATDPATAVGQVRQRVRQGGHDVEIDKIVASNQKARENFLAIKSLADKSKVINNSH
jgi:predicted ABC-type ATPase